MALFDQSSRHSLVPVYLYSSNALSCPINHAGLPTSSHSSSLPPHDYTRKNVPMIPSPNEGIRMFSPSYYAACSAGGVFSCGLTHMAVTPLDLVKCNMQVCMQYYNGDGKLLLIKLALMISLQSYKCALMIILQSSICDLN